MRLIAATFCASVLAWISSTAGAQSRIVVTGIVLDSASALPIQGVEVSIEEIRRSTSTDSLGDFRMTSLPSGVVSILFRKFGYRAVQLRFRLSEGDSIDRRIILGRASTVLDSVIISAGRSSGIPSFDENRHIGLGHFLTRAELATQGQRSVADILTSVPGAGILRGPTGRAYIFSKRMTPSACPPVSIGKEAQRTGCLPGQGFYVPGAYELRDGVKIACYAQVYLDNLLVNGSPPTEPFDISTIVADQLEAVEYYSGPSQLPLKYAKLDSRCGVLVLWTRRSQSRP